jgi:hypothetical protein
MLILTAIKGSRLNTASERFLPIIQLHRRKGCIIFVSHYINPCKKYHEGKVAILNWQRFQRERFRDLDFPGNCDPQHLLLRFSFVSVIQSACFISQTTAPMKWVLQIVLRVGIACLYSFCARAKIMRSRYG